MVRARRHREVVVEVPLAGLQLPANGGPRADLVLGHVGPRVGGQRELCLDARTQVPAALRGREILGDLHGDEVLGSWRVHHAGLDALESSEDGVGRF